MKSELVSCPQLGQTRGLGASTGWGASLLLLRPLPTAALGCFRVGDEGRDRLRGEEASTARMFVVLIWPPNTWLASKGWHPKAGSSPRHGTAANVPLAVLTQHCSWLAAHCLPLLGSRQAALSDGILQGRPSPLILELSSLQHFLSRGKQKTQNNYPHSIIKSPSSAFLPLTLRTEAESAGSAWIQSPCFTSTNTLADKCVIKFKVEPKKINA